ncbi:c-type cytochrome [Paraburkholderia megapolitana]|uniref:c-type cytochrome n=1 Tax=Paraburkholderia megapolitana TaxID=420953 RepID=UPI001FE883A1|nr:cytochrome c [Paraburkholderia megapolitana]
MNRHVVAFTVACLFLCATTSAADATPDAVARGHALFVSKGCFECHGYVGQGSIMSGPSIAPAPLPLAAMAAYIRAPKGQMPPYSTKILSDAELRDIHTYLESIPADPKLDTVALLKAERSQTVSTTVPTTLAHGEAVFAAHCAACHGAMGEGGLGPALKGVAGRLNVDGIAASVRNPAGAMPRLVPAVLSDQDVNDVARYVATLR